MITHQESLESFYKQLEYVLANYTPHNININDYNNIVIAGMGGSGIGGRLVKSYFTQTPVPVEVVSDYTLPAFANNKTILILSSYSGNTEETLSIFEQGKEKGCKMIAVTAGGKLLEGVKEAGMHPYLIETGFQPRMALGYSFGFLLKIFAELLNYTHIDAELQECIENLKEQDEHKEAAESFLKKFKNYLDVKFVIIADAQFEAVGIRACQQFQENSKKEAFCQALPEANHNVIESYYGKLDTNFILLNSGSHDRVGARFDFVSGLLEKENNRVLHLMVEEYSLRMVFSLIHKLDWLSIRVAEETHQNPMEIENIISLKDFLSDQEQ